MDFEDETCANLERYTRAMQTGVAYVRQHGNEDGNYLPVGISSAQINQAALVRLLIKKGVITEMEYIKAIADEIEREAARYEGLAQPA